MYYKYNHLSTKVSIITSEKIEEDSLIRKVWMFDEKNQLRFFYTHQRLDDKNWEFEGAITPEECFVNIL